MTDAKTQQRFVCLRSQGWSFARIPDQFHLLRPPALRLWGALSHEENCTISAPFCTIFGPSITEATLPQALKKCTRFNGAVLSCKGLSFKPLTRIASSTWRRPKTYFYQLTKCAGYTK